MSLKDLFLQDEDIIFNVEDFALSATYTFYSTQEEIETQVITEDFLSLESGNEKETTVFKLRKSIFTGKPEYKDTVILTESGEKWTVERVLNSGRINFTVLARRGERGVY